MRKLKVQIHKTETKLKLQRQANVSIAKFATSTHHPDGPDKYLSVGLIVAVCEPGS